MPNPWVRPVDRITGVDGVPVDVGADYSAVRLTIGIHSVCLEREQAEQFARAFVAACWEASDNARLMAEEAAT